MIAHTVLSVDFPLSSSVILVITVALWIFWVAPHFLRNRLRHQGAGGEAPVESLAALSSDPQAGMVMKMAAQQETVMDNRKSTTSGPGVSEAAQQGAFRIRYGRCALALVGLIALLTAVVTLPLLAFGAVSGTVPAVAALVAVTCVAILRSLAVRERRAKVQKAFADAMTSTPVRVVLPQKPAASPASAGDANATSPAPFDAESGSEEPKPLTPGQLRAAALAVAVAAGDTSAASKVAQPSTTPWEPVEVPKPVYVDAAKAERPAPEPLELPEAPKASAKTPLKQSMATEQRTSTTAKPHSALGNLDDVLQRRRA